MELYEWEERFTEFINLLSIMRDKKIADISSMHAPIDENFPFAFPLRYGPIQLVNLRSPQGIHEPVHIANQHMVYGVYCSIPEP
ncbi:hypothetical protein Goshw_007244 [Gossypium schwendimanii]|uniref:Uncharacterized protein n=2 Tax=Gossypium schwendimanii TaxID=34291 RepID=A0A7J9N527_GOSSC|nr:hypothetical protein [Gossypium schwendimanii]